MKILQLISYFNPRFGGDINVCTNLSKELAKQNHEVTIITTDFHFDLQYASMLRGEGITVIPFPCVAHLGLFLYTPSLETWLEKNLGNYDIIHLHNYRSYQNILVHKFSKRHRILYILQAHGTVIDYFEKKYLKKFYDFVWGYKILNGASKFIAVTKSEKDQYIKIGLPADKIEIIPNGIDVFKFDKHLIHGNFRKKYGIAPNEKIILYLGRLHKRKGIDFLVDGFSILSDQNKNVKLIIVGPNDGFLNVLKNQVKKLKIEDSVFFTDAVSENEKFEAFIESDLLVYPAIHEIFGLVPFEAIMSGLPVIVCDDCGCGEIIKEADCGYLVKFGDTKNLKETMIFALENDENNKKLIENGKRYFEKNLKWQNVGKKVETLYKKTNQDGKGE
jgi:glycosyltransferase involved in cell wall biosynthesis